MAMSDWLQLLTDSPLAAFVRPLYEAKDTMHDGSHLRRCAEAVQLLQAEHGLVADEDLLAGGLLLHGVIYEEGMEAKVRAVLSAAGCGAERAAQMIGLAWESQKDLRPETLEGGLLHDAHLLEGDENFLITKVLVTGTARGAEVGGDRGLFL